MEQILCKICGQPLAEGPNGIYKCNACLSKFKIEDDLADEQTLIQIAYDRIRKGNFSGAITICDSIVAKNEYAGEAYWVRALAKHGVIFVCDVNNRMVPTCQNVIEGQFLSDEDVKKAIELALPEIAASYKSQGARIEKFRKECIAKSKKTVKIKLKDVKGGKESQKASAIKQPLLQKRAIGANSTVEPDPALEEDVLLAKEQLLQGLWKNAAYTIESVLRRDPQNGEALICKLLLKTNKETLDDLAYAAHFTEVALLQNVLDAANAENAEKILEIFYAFKGLPKEEYLAVLKAIFPYECKLREENIQSLLQEAFESNDTVLFDLLLQTLDAEEVDRYIQLNQTMVDNLIKNGSYQQAKKYISNILSVNEGDTAALRSDCEIAWAISDGKFVKKFELLLKYSKDTNRCVQSFLSKILNDGTLLADDVDGLKNVLAYYKGQFSEMKSLMLLLVETLINNQLFKDAEYFNGLILNEDAQCKEAWVNLCLINAKAVLVADSDEEETEAENIDVDERALQVQRKQARISAKKKKRAVKTAGAALSSIAAIALIALLVIALIIPLIRMNEADKLFAAGKYTAANRIYKDLDGFGKSDQRAAVVKAIEQLEEQELEKGIKTLLSADVPVELTYEASGSVINTQVAANASGEGVTAGADENVPHQENTPEATVTTFTSSKDFKGFMNPHRNGYKFVKWELGTYSYDVAVKNAKFYLELKAVWEKVDYTIEYDLAGGSLSTPNVGGYDFEDESFTLSNPTRTGYTFAGWTGTGLSGAAIDVTIPSGSYGDRVYTATWTPKQYTVTFDANEGTVSPAALTVTYDALYTLPTPTRKGYTFLGWYQGVMKVTDGTWRKTSNITLTAKWQINDYDISYDFQGGTDYGANPSGYIVTQTFTLIDPQKTGYTFIGWTYEGQTTPIKNVTIEAGTIGNLSFTAHWEIIDYTITLNPNGGSVNGDTSITVNYNGNYTLPTATRTGYTFKGWYEGNTFVSSGTWLKTSGATLTAKWEIIYYSISYDMDGGTNANLNPTRYTVEDTFTLATPTRAGYDFRGWRYDGKNESTVTIAKGTTGDLSFAAIWSLTDYVVTLDPNGGSVSYTSFLARYTQQYSLPTPTRTGYTFAGWYNGSTLYSGGTWNTFSNVTLTASWTPIQYTITYDDVEFIADSITVTYDYNYEGVSDTTVTLTNGQTLTYPTAPTRSGYVFTGWYTTAECTTRYAFTGEITDDMTLYAGWQSMHSSNYYARNIVNPVNYYSSSYYYNGSTSGTSSSNQKYLYLVANESGTHYIYYRNGSSNSNYKTYIGVTNLTTGTTIKNTTTCSSTSYNYVSFNCNAGDVIAINFYLYYYSSNAYFYFSGFSTPTSTATASCSTVEGLTYNTESSYEDTVDYDENYTLPTPTRTGYTFAGWYNGETKVESGVWNTTTDVTLTAQWTINTYTITFDAAGGTVSPTSKTVTYNTEYTLPTPTRTGYTFAGWYNGETQYTDGTWTGLADVTLTAQWTANQYDITYEDVETVTNSITVTYDYNYEGDTDATVTLTNGQTLSYPTVPTRSGYAFAGWYTDSSYTTPYNFSGTITADITLYAKWFSMTSSYYSREYVDIANYTSSSSKKSITISAPSSSSKNYYYFTCYKSGSYSLNVVFSSGDFYVSVYNATSGSTVLNQTNMYSGNSSTRTATFTANAGDVIYVSLYKYSSGGATGYGSFYVTNASYPTSTAIASCSTVAGLLYSPESSYEDTVDYDENYTLPTPIRTGYTFTGWYNGETLVESGAWNITSDVTLTAHWTIGVYTITLNANGGTVSPTTQSVTYNTEYALPTPTRTGYTFNGWYSGDTQYSGGTWTTGNDVELVASWTANDDISYVVKHYLQNIDDDEYTLDDDATQNLTGTADAEITPAALSYAGFTAPELQTVTIAPDGTLVVNYYYTRNSYTVTFVTNGGTAIDSITQKYDSEFDLSDAERTGYTFGGWFTDAGLTAELEDAKVAGYNMTLYAYWTEEAKAGDFSYSGTESITISGYTGTDTEIQIPSYIKGLPVTTIASYAFQNESTLTEIVVPESVTTIGEGAFKGCSALEDVTLPFIGKSADATAYEAVFGYIFGYTTTSTTSTSYGYSSYSSTAFYNKQYSSVSGATWQYACLNYSGSSYYHNRSYFYYIPASVKNVTITSQTTIPTAAFNGCNFIESITIPTTTTNIGEYAFQGCSALNYLNSTTEGQFNIPTGITEIKGYTFKGCDSLLDPVIPNGVTSIGSYAFADCDLLPEVDLPATVESIGSYAFSGCISLEKVNSDTDGELTLPTGVTTIGEYAFKDLESITKIVIPNNVTSIGSSAFYGCDFVESITLPFVGNSADSTSRRFSSIWGTIPSTLKSVTVSAGTTIPEYAFSGCSTIESITIPTTVESIGAYAFQNCAALKRLNSTTDGEFNIPEGVTEIKSYTFNGCESLTEIVISANITSIGNYAFYSCVQLESVEFATDSKLETIGSYAFANCTLIEELQLPEMLTTIGSYAFSGCTSIEKINSDTEGELTLPASVTTIGEYAFGNLSSITSIVIPNTVTSIGYYAFYGCSAIEEITLPFVGNSADSTSSFSYVMGSIPSTLKNVTISADTTIPESAFSGCSTIESITIPTTTESIGEYAFYNCTALKRLNSTTDGEFNVPAGVTEIKYYAFYNCDAMTKVVISANVTGIGEHAFYGCALLEDLTFATDSKLETIGSYAFASCIALTEVQIPETVTSIGSYAFSGCTALAKMNSDTEGELTLPASVTTIGSYAFQNLSLITKVIVKDSVTTVGLGAFKGCNALEDITLPFIGKSADATAYEAVFGYIFGYTTQNATSTSYGYAYSSSTEFVNTQYSSVSGATWQYACLNYYYSSYYRNQSYFYYIPTSIKNVTITSQTTIPTAAFNGCSFIRAITVPTTATSIGAYAFKNCSALLNLNSTTDGEFNIPASVTEIQQYAFYNCNAMTKVVISANVTSIGQYAFSGCTALAKVNSDTEGEMILPENLITIGSYAFQNLSSITKIVVNDNVNNIGQNAFYGCSALEDITLPFIGSSIDSTSSFSYAMGTVPSTLKTVTISVDTTIPTSAFYGCTTIESITLPSTVESVGSNAFYNCGADVSYTYNPTLSYWNGTAISTSFSGSGTEDDPYQINSAADFAYFESSVNNGTTYEGKYFVLNVDINLNNQLWTPIGTTKANSFAGTFDGNGKKIYNLAVVEMSAAYVGLFGYVSGTIENLGIVSGNVGALSTAARLYIGALAGYLMGTVENCYAQANVSLSVDGMIYVGGLIGYVDTTATVTDSYASGTVSATSTGGFAHAGGFVGSNEGTIDGCMAFGNVTAHGSDQTHSRNGGFTATNSGTLTDCYRSETQVLTQYTTVGSAYNEEGTADSVADMISYAETNWDSSIWEFDLKYPNHQ